MNTQLVGEYSNIWIFQSNFEYSNIHFKGNMHQYIESIQRHYPIKVIKLLLTLEQLDIGSLYIDIQVDHYIIIFTSQSLYTLYSL